VTDVRTALVEVMREVTAVGKDGVNQQQNYSFRGADQVVNAVAPAFRRHGIVVAPQVIEYRQERIETGGRDTKQHRASVLVTYSFTVPGCTEPLVATVAAEACDSADKATSKALTVAFRTVLLQVLSLPTADADEVTPAMVRKMMATFKEAGITDRQGRLDFASEVIGRELESTTDLSSSEWQQIVEQLESGINEPKHEVSQ